MSCNRSTLSLLLAFPLAGVLASCSEAPPPPFDALLVTIDTLRGDRWGCTGDPAARTPVADRIARGGTLAFEGRAAAPITLPSHTSMMTGLPPASHGVRDNGSFVLPAEAGRTLAESFRAAGYATAAFVSAYPLASRFGLDRGFDRYDSYLGESEEEAAGAMRERRGDELVGRVRRYFDRGRAPGPETPLFVWAHFFDPHAPYDAPAPWSAALAADAYRGEIAFADHCLGLLVNELSARRPEAVRAVLLTSDHGEGLGEHGELTHGVLLHAATLRVPLVAARFDRYAPHLLAAPVSLESVPRTLLALAALDDSLDEGSAAPLEAPPAPVLSETMYPWFNFGWRALRAWEFEGWKLVSGESNRVYSVAGDPGELHDVAAAEPEIVRRLKNDLLAEWARRRSAAFTSAHDALAEEDVEALRALGYAAGGASGGLDEEKGFASGPDPQERAPLVDRLNLAITRRGHGDPEGARRELLAVVEADPRNRLAWEELGGVELDRGEPAAAREAFVRALDLGRNPPWVPLLLAEAHRRLGDTAAERDALRKALAVDPSSVPARANLARLALAAGDSAGALRYMEESVEIRPRSPAAQLQFAELLEARGDRTGAVEHWRRAAELDPDGPAGARARERLASVGAGGR